MSKISRLATTLVLGCFATSHSAEIAPAKRPVDARQSGVRRAFFPYVPSISDSARRSLEDQALLYRALGYAGVGELAQELGFPGFGHPKGVTVAERVASLEKQGLRLILATGRIRLGAEQPIDLAKVKEIIPSLAEHKTTLGVVLSGNRKADLDAKAVAVLKQLADIAQPHGVEIAIYPHAGDYAQTVKEASRLAAKVNRPQQVGVIFNLYHWMRVDRDRDLRTALTQARPWLKFVNIHGSSKQKAQVLPLDQGDFDLGQVITILDEIAYRGPVGLFCYSIGGDAREHLTTSMQKWKALNSNVPEGAIMLFDGTEATPVNFNRDVRPILSDRCFHCHGPDKRERKGKLRLDQADGEHGAYRIRGGIPALKPGDLEESELWYRLTTDDEDDVMPPVDSHKKPLTAAERAIIKRWIEEGAKYDTFWAFKKPVIVHSSSKGEWGDGPIDRYVLARLEAESLSPSPEADKRTLLRRLTFDLTGLPPTLDELAEFDADQSPDAYRKRVDALLARPHYGEHMARYWADLVRLADTNGLHTDRPRDFSAYRDWVIRAFNANQPFDRFVRDQVAGDLHENPTVDQLVASGFNRMHLMFERGSVLPEESLYRNVLGRVEVIGTAFLGLTVQCAQCHDHKYDPISQREFFQLYAFFNNFDGEPQTGPAEPNGIQEPSVPVPPAGQEGQKAKELDARLEALRAELAAVRPTGVRLPPTKAPTVQYWNFDEGRGATAANKIRTGNQGTLAGSPTWRTPGVESPAALGLNASTGDYVDGGNIKLSATASGGQVSVSMWLQPDSLGDDNRIIGQPTGDASQAGSVRVLANGAMEVWSGSSWLQVAPAGALSVGFWQHLALVWIGESVTAYMNGIAQETAAAGFHFGAENGAFGIGAPFLRQYGASFDGKIDEVAVFDTALTRAQVSALAGEQPRAGLVAELKGKIDRINRERQAQARGARRAMVMRERNPPRKARIRIRGAYDQPGEEVPRGTPAFLPPLDVSGEVPSRMDLANWLVSPEHPLTARVAVNRFWQQFLGVGLVKTTEDFGAQGEWPSHPELLDYLAVRFVESGWDVKALVREIVLSATYRQQSDATPAAYRADAENRLLARGSRYRMDAEMIRDQLLMVSGKLNPEMYGKSVKPPQPPGLWKSVTMTNELFQPDRGAAIHRRSLYTYWKRVMPPPQMSIMNAPSREFCIARRERTNTPLQALLLMNEPEYFKLARSCAERTLREVENDRARALPRIYERITSHKPGARELAILEEALDDLKDHYESRRALAREVAPGSTEPVRTAAWTLLAHSLLNLESVKVRR